jgi:glutathione S-transferase
MLVDSDRVVGDSWTIATYLEDTYPDRRSWFRRQSRSRPRDVISALVLILQTVGGLSTRDLRVEPLESRRCRAIRGSEYGRYRSFRSDLI